MNLLDWVGQIGKKLRLDAANHCTFSNIRISRSAREAAPGYLDGMRLKT